MNNCYDCPGPVQSKSIRVLCALVLMLSAQAIAQPAATRPLWHADVQAPRPGLPAVAIDAGYPGPYLPYLSSPIEMRAVSSDVSFDGYIGFHFAVGDWKTLDTPVIARASLRPRETWTFRTFAGLRRWGGQTSANAVKPREIVVEWRDRAMKIVAMANAGTPPWSTYAVDRLDLRVVGATDPIGNVSAFGRTVYAERAGALADRGQWYAGFRRVIVPLAAWLDLRQPVRDAIFGSAVPVVLAGLPSHGQQLDAMTRALLPVVFTDRPGSYATVWPSPAAEVAAPMSWTAKSGAAFVGSPQNPYIARTITATWVADEHALEHPTPSMLHAQSRAYNVPLVIPDAPIQGRIIAGLALLVAIAAWALARTNHTAVAVAVIAVFAGGVAIVRDRIRPQAAIVDRVTHGSLGPDLAIDYRSRWAHGPTPIAATNADRAAITGDYGLWNDAEIRTDDTSPSMGLLHRTSDWAFNVRWIMRRQLATPGSKDRTIFPSLHDLHSLPAYELKPALNDRVYGIDGELTVLANDRVSATFALPAAGLMPGQTARIEITAALNAAPVEVAWATGSTRFTANKKNILSNPDFIIPDDLVREIVRAGGIFTVTCQPAEVVQPYQQILLRVQEKKS